MKNITMITILVGVLLAGLAFSMAWPFTPIECRIVNITEVQHMNSGLIIWGYWDNSTVEEHVGLFQSGFKHYEDVGHTYEICFKEQPNPNIRCLILVRKIELS